MNTNGNGFSRWRWPFLWKAGQKSPRTSGELHRLALQLHYDLPSPESPRSVLLVAPAASTVLAHSSPALAHCLAEQLPGPVLLVDACPKSPEVSHILASEATRGFSELLADPKLPLDDLVLPTTHENLWFLPAGSVGSSSPIAPDSVSPVLRELGNRYDFVVFSGGSVLNNSVVLALSPYVGCVLLLAIEHETRLEDLDTAQDTLSYCRARKVGLIFTTDLSRKPWSL